MHPSQLYSSALELVRFVASLEMGEFYSEQILELLKPKDEFFRTRLTGSMSKRDQERRESSARDYKERIRSHADKATALVVELLRYQGWSDVRARE